MSPGLHFRPPSTLMGLAHILQWASKFTRKHVKSSLGGEIFARSEMWDHVGTIREFHMALRLEKIRSYGMIDCESLLSHLRKFVSELRNFSLGICVAFRTPWKVEILEMLHGSL